MTKRDFHSRLPSLTKKIASNKTQDLLAENELKKLRTFDAAYFKSRNDFDDDDTQNYLVFQPAYKYFKIKSNKISSWESKGLSNEKIRSITYNNNNAFARSLVYLNDRLKVKFNGNFLKQDKVT